MPFVSPLFLWYFMPLTLAAIVLLPRGWRNGIIAIASLVFYAAGAGSYTLLLVACIAVNFSVGLLLEPRDWEFGLRRRQYLLIAVIVFNLSILLVWKYATFISEQFAALAKLIGTEVSTIHLSSVIGISFFTFHHISYVVDIYRGERPALRNPVSFITYIAMFPQLAAGPIVRYREIADQLAQKRSHRLDDIAAGFPRFALGLSKKVIIADSLAPLVNACFATPQDQMTFTVAWLGAIGYTLQLYFDFSGYSDMAIGLGRMLGFRLPENFNRPYSSVTITEFWRRWHMSLSRWFKDYLYIPLGGNRHGVGKTYRNLAIVFILTGFWHGASWVFLIWGVYHGALLIVERAGGWNRSPATAAARAARRAFTLLLVIIGWVFFKSTTLSSALTMLSAMFFPDFAGLTDSVAAALTHQRLFLLVLALAVVFLPARPTGPYLESARTIPAQALRITVMTFGVAYSAVLVATGTFSPFLYYQF